VLAREAGFLPIVWLDCKGPRSLRENLVAPLIIEGWADVVRMTQCRHGSALKTLKDALRFQVGIPCSSVHG
jgi:hypothetical protein